MAGKEMNAEEIVRIVEGMFSERISKEWEQANRIHDAQTIATRAIGAQVEGLGVIVNGMAVKVDWLYNEAQNGGIPSRVGMSTKVKVAIWGFVGTVLSGVGAAIITVLKS